MDWVSGIDLTQPQVVTDKCLDMLQNPTPQDCINELALYGISAYPTGLPTIEIIIPGISTPMTWHTSPNLPKPWQVQELQDILIGVEQTAMAFDMLANQIQPDNTEDAKTLFRRIMGDFYVLSAMNGFTLYDGDGCNGTLSASCTSNTIGAITFYNMTANQYTMVHEIGHRFNARSDGGNGRTSNSLYGRMQNAKVCEEITRDGNGNVTNWCSIANGSLVFGRTRIRLQLANDINMARGNNGWQLESLNDGEYVDEWRRGDRGWGSGPGTPFNEEVNLVITNYQQHSFHIDDWSTPFQPNLAIPEQVRRAQLREREIDEATADMFLNWIYRKATNGQEGFRNLSWLLSVCQAVNKTVPCEIDGQVPGDRCFEWVNVNMIQIFNQAGTSWR